MREQTKAVVNSRKMVSATGLCICIAKRNDQFKKSSTVQRKDIENVLKYPHCWQLRNAIN